MATTVGGRSALKKQITFAIFGLLACVVIASVVSFSIVGGIRHPDGVP
jgi:hypothetical protein